MPTRYKILTILGIMALTFLYAYFTRQQYAGLETADRSELILEQLPPFEALRVRDDQLLSSGELLGQSELIAVHFWGTWCAPCEVEFPDLMKLTQRLSNRSVHFYLVAVNDKKEDVKTFLKRFPGFSQKTTVLLDEDGSSMKQFGTVKVPETYLFDKSGKAVKKYVGPQDWHRQSYTDQFVRLLTASP